MAFRLRDLEGISKSLKYYKDTYNSLDEWSKEMEAKQLKAQENQPEDSKALAEFLNQQKVRKKLNCTYVSFFLHQILTLDLFLGFGGRN